MNTMAFPFLMLYIRTVKELMDTGKYREHSPSGRSWLLGKVRHFLMIWVHVILAYFHILAVKMSKPDTFEEGIRGPFAKLKALSTPVISYFIRRTSKG